MTRLLLIGSTGSTAPRTRSPRVHHAGPVVLKLFICAMLLLPLRYFQAGEPNSSLQNEAPTESAKSAALANKLGIAFFNGSTSSLVIERGGKKYVVDVVARSVREVDAAPTVTSASLDESQSSSSSTKGSDLGRKVFADRCAFCHGSDGKGIRAKKTPDFTDPAEQASLTDQVILETIRNGRKGTAMPAWKGKLSDEEIHAVASHVRSLGGVTDQQKGSESHENERVYEPADDYLFTLPTGRRLDRQGLYVNFTHRFAFDPAFSGRARGDVLLGLDGFGIASFGLRYGVSDKLSVSIYRSPSVIGRPIELMAAYNFLDERDGYPLNAAFRISVDGQGDFSRNFTTNLEGIFSRSLLKRAQIYVVPTLSLEDRRLISNPILDEPPPATPGINTFSLGIGGALDVRPTVALIAEVIPTLANARALGIHRPAYSFGIQKRLWHHAFTLGFSNGPGTTVAQRAGTRATFLNDPTADTPGGLFIGFDLMRQFH